MTDLLAALARSVETARNLMPAPEPEAVEDVFADKGDLYQRFNADWHQRASASRGAARESKEGSP